MILKTEGRPVRGYGWVYLVIAVIVFMPVGAIAGIWLDFEWEPNPEPDIAGYLVFKRLPGDDYNYKKPAWDGPETHCSIWIDDEKELYLFVVRAVDEDNFQSDDSNEVVYSGDGRYLYDGSEPSTDSKSDSGGGGGGCFISSLK